MVTQFSNSVESDKVLDLTTSTMLTMLDLVKKNKITPSQQNENNKNHQILDLPMGDLGLHFSSTVPCEICRVDEDSPIFDESVQLMGRLAFRFSIPNKIDIRGELDNDTLEKILSVSSDIPNRKLLFKDRGEKFNKGLVTMSVLPTGPISASFMSSKGFFKSRNFKNNKVFVHRTDEVTVEFPMNNDAPKTKMNLEFPIGHYVEKVIIPNHLVLEGGVRTPQRLIQTLDNFAMIPGRIMVFRTEIPKGGSVAKVTLPSGPTGINFCSDVDDKCELPLISTVLEGSSAWHLNVPINHIVEKVIIPNKIMIERTNCASVEKLLESYAGSKRRVLVLQEFRRDVLRAGSKITITLPPGELGLVFNSNDDALWIADVKPHSQLLHKIPSGYYIESLVIPGELELKGKKGLKNVFYLAKVLKEFSHLSNRILTLQQYKADIQKPKRETTFGEIVWSNGK